MRRPNPNLTNLTSAKEQAKSRCKIPLLAVKENSKLVLLHGHTLARIQTFSAGLQINSPAAWDPSSNTLLVSATRISVTASSVNSIGVVMGLKLNASCMVRTAWKNEVGSFNQATLGYSNSFSPVVVGPVGKRVLFAISGTANSTAASQALRLVALSVDSGRLLWSSPQPVSQFIGEALSLSPPLYITLSPSKYLSLSSLSLSFSPLVPLFLSIYLFYYLLFLFHLLSPLSLSLSTPFLFSIFISFPFLPSSSLLFYSRSFFFLYI